jgi:hypothetical protein
MLERMEKTMAIEHTEFKRKNRCGYYHSQDRCRLADYVRPAHSSIQPCSDCPLWPATDAIYEDLAGRQIDQTYVWWREQWIKGINGGQHNPYALERMASHVKVSTKTPDEQAAIEVGWKTPRRSPLEAVSSLVSGSKTYLPAIGFGIAFGILIILFVLNLLSMGRLFL